MQKKRKKKKCKCMKNRKHLPYGTKALTGYCHACDIGPTLDVSKSGERHKSKIKIIEEINEELNNE